MTTLLEYPEPYEQIKASRADSTDDECSCDSSSHCRYKTNIIKYKTEICKNFSEMGFCPYRTKCQFAHGLHELHMAGPLPKKAYRTKKCKSFWEQGMCRYGFRCQFLHYEEKDNEEKDFLTNVSLLMRKTPNNGTSRLLQICGN